MTKSGFWFLDKPESSLLKAVGDEAVSVGEGTFPACEYFSRPVRELFRDSGLTQQVSGCMGAEMTPILTNLYGSTPLRPPRCLSAWLQGMWASVWIPLVDLNISTGLPVVWPGSHLEERFLRPLAGEVGGSWEPSYDWAAEFISDKKSLLLEGTEVVALDSRLVRGDTTPFTDGASPRFEIYYAEESGGCGGVDVEKWVEAGVYKFSDQYLPRDRYFALTQGDSPRGKIELRCQEELQWRRGPRHSQLRPLMKTQRL